jgi:hypothetical protein
MVVNDGPDMQAHRNRQHSRAEPVNAMKWTPRFSCRCRREFAISVGRRSHKVLIQRSMKKGINVAISDPVQQSRAQ